jgi:outer membrane protein TolC
MNSTYVWGLLGLLCAAFLNYGYAAEETSRPRKPAAAASLSIGSRSLPHLTELTLAHSPNVGKAKEAMDLADLALRNARVAFLPTLDLDATHGYQDSHPNGANPWTPYASQLNLNLSETLYDNGAAITNYQVAKAAFDQMKLDYEQQRDNQLNIMAQAYLDWSASSQQRQIDETKRGLLRGDLNLLEAQYKQGLKTRRDVLRMQTEISRLQLTIQTRDNEVDLNFNRLAGAVGLSRTELEKEGIQSEEPKAYNNIEEKDDLKIEDHRRRRILDLVKKQADLKINLADREDLPRVNVTGAAGYHLAGYLGVDRPLYQDTKFDWSALVVVKYSLWDWGTRRRNVEIARVTADNVADDNRQQLFDLANDLRNTRNKLREFHEQTRMTRELVVIEQQAYNLLEAEYRNGRVNYLDLILGLNSLIDARSKVVAADFGLKKQQMLYLFHKGILYDALK